jgi:hypothetical protein
VVKRAFILLILAWTDFHQPLPGPGVDRLHDALDDKRVVQKVLAEPFPWTVIQGVIHVFVIIYSQL